MRRLSETLLPVWRYAAVTEPLGERLAEVIAFQGSVTDSDGIDHFRIVDGDRLMWASPETTWEARPRRFAPAIQRRIATIFPQLGKVAISDVFGGAVGLTVHGMPQIGQLRKGLWVASGFGRQGLNTSAMAGQVIARSILWGDERWRLFSPFELVWAGGADRPRRRPCDRHVGAGQFRRGRRAGPLPRRRAGQGARARGASGGGQPAGRNQSRRARRRRAAARRDRSRRGPVSGTGRQAMSAAASQESEKIRAGSV